MFATQASYAALPTSLPPQGLVVKDEATDFIRTELSAGLTPLRTRALLRAADAGNIADALQLFEEIEDKDPRLKSVLGTRRMALTGLDWDIVSAAELSRGKVDQALADEAAAFCREKLGDMDAFGDGLKHLSDAIGPSVAVLEMEWRGTRLVGLHPVLTSRLHQDFYGENPRQVRILTKENSSSGVPAEWGKFIVHTPHARQGLPLRGSLLRSLAMIYLIKSFAIKNWAIFIEVFGMPIRVARYDTNAQASEKTELLAMLRTLGTDAVGIFSKSVDLELKGVTDRRNAPYLEIIEWGSKEIAITVLGQNLTTDTTGGTGTHAAADVQDRIRMDLLEGDIVEEEHTIRRQLLGPLVRWEYPIGAPVPFFKRKKPELIDRVVESQVISTAQQAGVKVPLDWAHKTLGIPKPQEGEAVLDPPAPVQGPGPFDLGALSMNSGSEQTAHGAGGPVISTPGLGGGGGPSNVPRAVMPGRDTAQKGAAITKIRAAIDAVAADLGKSPVQLLESDLMDRVLASYKAEEGTA